MLALIKECANMIGERAGCRVVERVDLSAVAIPSLSVALFRS